VVDVPQIKKHDLYDNAGPSFTGLSKDEVTAEEELAAFDHWGRSVPGRVEDYYRATCGPFANGGNRDDLETDLARLRAIGLRFGVRIAGPALCEHRGRRAQHPDREIRSIDIWPRSQL
jgi:hypothetical protein